MTMSNQAVVKARRETLASCMTCPLCDKLLKDATTISECLHSFCRKCIYKKLTDEEVDCCPICNIDLGCVPVEKLRPDHNLQDVRAKVFPFKRRKVEAPDIMPPIPLPVRRKERSLSSLVVSTPRMSTQTGLTGRRTKAVARNAATLRGCNFSIREPTKKEDNPLEDNPESSSSPETLNKIAQNRRQVHKSSTTEPDHNKTSDQEAANGSESWTGNGDLWKPLNCLVEAANRTKSVKHNIEASFAKSDSIDAPDRDIRTPKTKGREHMNKPKVRDVKNGVSSSSPGTVKPRKHRMGRKRAASSTDRTISAQAVLDAMSVKRDRRTSPIWFTLVASDDQEGDAPLPQISASYLRIKDGTLPVSFIQKYLVEKLNLTSEAEVDITCCGQSIVPSMQLHDLVDLWLQTATTQRVHASIGTPAKDFLMVLVYARKVQPQQESCQ